MKRRVLLAVAIVVLVLGGIAVNFRAVSSNATSTEVPYPFPTPSR